MDQTSTDTHYAPAARLDRTELLRDIALIANNPLIDEVMNASGGLFAILNAQRQIVAVNESFLASVGIHNAGDVLGLRLGEQLNCVHACEMPGGCGTSEYCSSCGAVIAIVSALAGDTPVEQNCIIRAEKDYQEVDLYFNVRCSPMDIEGSRFVLIFLQDVSIHQQWAYLERTFLHDISNTLQGLIGTSCVMTDESKVTAERLKRIRSLSERMAREIAVQRTLSSTLSHSYQPLYADLSVRLVFDELQDLFNNHALCAGRELEFTPPPDEIRFVSDQALVVRVLANMISNALEATTPPGTVRITVDTAGETVVFCVWNPGEIPADTARRIFQRNFTTKEGLGHGLGTYSMKLFGEKVLGGRVDFSTSAENGTTFRFALQCS